MGIELVSWTVSPWSCLRRGCQANPAQKALLLSGPSHSTFISWANHVQQKSTLYWKGRSRIWMPPATASSMFGFRPHAIADVLSLSPDDRSDRVCCGPGKLSRTQYPTQSVSWLRITATHKTHEPQKAGYLSTGSTLITARNLWDTHMKFMVLWPRILDSRRYPAYCNIALLRGHSRGSVCVRLWEAFRRLHVGLRHTLRRSSSSAAATRVSGPTGAVAIELRVELIVLSIEEGQQYQLVIRQQPRRTRAAQGTREKGTSSKF